MGRIRGYMLPRSLASQCHRCLEATIPHLDWNADNYKVFLPSFSIGASAWMGILVATLVLVVLIVHKKIVVVCAS